MQRKLELQFLLVPRGGFREAFEQRERGGEMDDGFLIGVALDRRSSRVLIVPEGPLEIVSLLKVYRKFSGNFSSAISIRSFKPFPDGEVELLPPLDWHAFVPQLLVQRMAEGIACCLSSVRPLTETCSPEEFFPSYEGIAVFFNPFYVCLQSRSDSRSGKLSARHTRGFQSLGGWQG